jgi:7-cyano-7-deazaguanine synthase
MPRCVVLLSGGLDSATALAIAKSLGFEPYALSVVYGQRHHAEIKAARRVAEAIGVAEHRFVTVGLDEIGGSALTDDIAVPKDRHSSEMASEIPLTYVPARNTVFLSLALGYAEVVGCLDIFIGVNAVDYSGYPDCRPEFIQAFEQLANLATKAGVEGAKFRVHAPLIEMSKVEIIRRGLELGVDYSLTHSCYDPAPEGRPCGHCDSCLIRQRAFEELGMEDPALSRVAAEQEG